MKPLDALTAWCLRRAVRRWPEHQREEQAREWTAELAALREDPAATAWSRLWFAASLATSPGRVDGSEVGWRDVVSRSGGRAVLLVAAYAVALVAGGVAAGTGHMIGIVFGRPPLAVVGALGAAFPVAGLGWWLGRRRPIRGRRAAFAGATASAGAIAFVFWRTASLEYLSGDEQRIATLSLIVAAVTWAMLMAVLVAAVGRRPRPLVLGLALLGVPLVIELAVAAAGLVATAGTGTGVGRLFTLAPAFAFDAAPATLVFEPNGALLSNIFGNYPEELLVLSVLALAYAMGCATSPNPLPVPGAEPGRSRLTLLSTRDVAVAVGGLVVALAAWAYTLTVLTPGISDVSGPAPMPGGDGELYLWVSELRWASIVVAGLCLLVATSVRRAGPLASGLLVAMLVGVDAGLARAGVSGSDGLRLAALAALACAATAWWVAGPRRLDSDVEQALARRWLAVGAVGAAACGPVVLTQGTPTVNHPFLPWLQGAAMAAVPAVAVLLAGVVVLALRDRPLRTAARVALLAGPTLVVGAAGIGTATGVDQLVTGLIGGSTAAGLAVVVMLLLRREPASVWRWSLVGAAAIGGTPLLYLYIYAALFPAQTLFVLAGTGYPADGLSLVPGAVILVIPAALVYAVRRFPAAPVPATGLALAPT